MPSIIPDPEAGKKLKIFVIEFVMLQILTVVFVKRAFDFLVDNVNIFKRYRTGRCILVETVDAGFLDILNRAQIFLFFEGIVINEI